MRGPHFLERRPECRASGNSKTLTTALVFGLFHVLQREMLTLVWEVLVIFTTWAKQKSSITEKVDLVIFTTRAKQKSSNKGNVDTRVGGPRHF